MKYKYMPINRKIMSVCMSLMILLTTLTPITSIIIAPQEVTRIEITPDKVILNITEQIDFDINAYPKGVYLSNVTWGVSNSEIGFIDSNGVFTASDVGNTTIIATNGNMTATAYISIKHKTQTFFEDNVTTQLAEDNVTQSIDSNIKQNNPITAQTSSQYVFSINETKEISIGENTTFNITLNTPFDRQGIHLINVKFRIELTNNLVGEIIYYTPPEQGSTLTISPYMPTNDIEVIISHLSGSEPAINLGAIKVRGDATGNTKINISGIEVKLWCPSRIPTTITNFENQNGTLEVMLLPLEKIEVTPQNTSILSSEIIQFTASPTPFGHPLEYLIWEVSDNSIGTIDVNGLFTPILPGIVNIIARHGNITANTTLTVLPSLRDGVDNIELTWNTDGWENWFLQNTIAFYEGDAIESGEISHGHYSWVETTVEGPGNLSFYWTVSSEFEKDFLIFKINGIEQDRISGTNHTWTQKSYELDSGINELRWKFIKDASVSRGTDSGWLDKVVFEPIFSKINITPDITEAIIGQNRYFDAILSPESINQTVIWSIDNESIGIIDSQTGLFTARAIGTANITATSVIDNNYSENAIIRVVANPHLINITPSNSIVYAINAQQFTATISPENSGTMVTWSIDNESIGIIDSQTGLFTANAIGTANITATSVADLNITNTTTVTVYGLSLCNALDNNRIWVTGETADWFGQTETVHYGGDAAESGNITNHDYTYLKTTIDGHYIVSFYWTVSSEFEKDFLIFKINGIEQDRISGTNHTWTEVWHEIGPGTTTLEWRYTKDCSKSHGLDRAWLDKVSFNYAPIKMNITPNISEILIGQNITLNATIYPNKVNQTVHWSVDNTTVGIINATTGKFTANVTGLATITARSLINRSMVATATISVAENAPQNITILPPDAIYVNTTTQFRSSVYPINSGEMVYWSVDNNEIGAIDKITGEFTAHSIGMVNIIATSATNSSVVANITIIVKYQKPTYIDILPIPLPFDIGESVYFTALVSPKNTTNKKVTWSVDNTTVGIINATTGKFTANVTGSTNVIAASITHPNKTNNVAIVVRPIPKHINISVQNKTTHIFDIQTLNATVHPENANRSVVWGVDNETVGTINATTGEFTARAVGIVNITARSTALNQEHILANVTIEVIYALPTGITISPSVILPQHNININKTQQFSATVLPDGGANQSVVWSVDNETVGTINETGYFTAHSLGMVRINATSKIDPNITRTAIVHVIPTLEEALDAINLTWTTDGHHNYRWHWQEEISYYGESAAKSEFHTVPHRRSSWIDTTIEGPGMFSFYLKFDDRDWGGHCSMFRFFINNARKSRIIRSTNTDWMHINFMIRPGNNSLRLDHLANRHRGLALYLDKVEFIPGNIFITQHEQSITVDREITFSAKVPLFDDDNQSVVWSVDNETVGTINATTGIFTANAVGIINITATSSVDPNITTTTNITVIPFQLPTILNIDGYTYTLNESVINLTETAIIIDANNIVLDGMGHTLDGNHTNGVSGIVVKGDNVIIKNLTITDWDIGIQINGSNNTIQNNIIKNNTNGVQLSSFNILRKNNFSSNERGIHDLRFWHSLSRNNIDNGLIYLNNFIDNQYDIRHGIVGRERFDDGTGFRGSGRYNQLRSCSGINYIFNKSFFIHSMGNYFDEAETLSDMNGDGIIDNSPTFKLTHPIEYYSIANITVEQPEKIVITPKEVIIEVSDSILLSARVLSTNTDARVIWGIDNEEIGTICQTGTFIANKVGITTITATSVTNPEIISTIRVTVVHAPISILKISPNIQSLILGENAQFNASIYPSCANQAIIWSVDNETVGNITKNGFFTTNSSGIVNITATSVVDSLISTTRTIEVFANGLLIKDAVVSYNATTQTEVILHNITDLGGFKIEINFNPDVVKIVNFTNHEKLSDRHNISDFSNERNGSIYIASFGENKPSLNGSVILTTISLKAIGNASETSQLNLTIHRLINSSGGNLSTDINIINGTFSIKEVKPTEIDIIPSRSEINIFESVDFDAIVHPISGANQDVVWNVDNDTVGTICVNGVFTAHSLGTANIIVRSAICQTIFNTLSITVSPTDIAIIPNNPKFELGNIREFTAIIMNESISNHTVYWSVNNEDIGTINATTGIFTANAIGTINVIATSVENPNISASTIVTVEPRTIGGVLDNPYLNFQKTDSRHIILLCSGYYDNDSIRIRRRRHHITTTVLGPGIFSFYIKGEHHWHKRSFFIENEGETTFRWDDVKFLLPIHIDKVTFNPFPTRVVISPPMHPITVNESATFSATVFPINPVPTNQDVIWDVDNELVGTIDSNGVFNAIAPGNAIITARSATHSAIYGKSKIVVYENPLVCGFINITQPTSQIRAGDTYIFNAITNPENMDIVWSVCDTEIGTINSITGKFVAKSIGNITIIATSIANNSIIASIPINIEFAPPDGMYVVAEANITDIGRRILFSATVLPKNNSNQSIRWSVDNTTVGTIDATTGLFTARVEGIANITATSNVDSNITGTKSIIVRPDPINITISYEEKVLNILNINLGAVHEVWDFDTQLYPNISNQKVFWSVDNASVGTVDENGFFNSLSAGVVNVTATSFRNPELNATAKIIVLTPASILENNFTWNTNDDGDEDNWFGQIDEYFYGSDAMISANISDNQYSEIRTTNIKGPGVISFNWKVSSEARSDFLRFYIGDREIFNITGEVDWTQQTHSVGNGTHTFRWKYQKDGHGSYGLDRGWLDKVEFNSVGIVIEQNPMTLTMGESATFTVRRFGDISGYDDDDADSVLWNVTDSKIGTICRERGTFNAKRVGRTFVIAENVANPNITARAMVTVLPNMDDALDIDENGITINATNTGDAEWIVQRDVSYDGDDAIESGDIGDDEAIWLNATVTGPGVISFYRKVSTEGENINIDYFKFFVNGNEIEEFRMAGELDWRRNSFAVYEGNHTFRWKYVKDGSGSSRADRVWLDNISFKEGTPLPTNIIVTPRNVEVMYNRTIDFNATVYPMGITQTVNWSVKNAAIGTINNQGLFSAKKLGTTNIIAQSENVERRTQVTVTHLIENLTIEPYANITLIVSENIRFNATAYPSDANQSVKWSVNNSEIGTIHPNGTFITKTSGIVNITATSVMCDNINVSATVVVQYVSPTNMSITPLSGRLHKRGTFENIETIQFNATLYPNNTNQRVIWNVDNHRIGRICENGIFTPGRTAGVVNITATSVEDSNLTATAIVTVLDAPETIYIGAGAFIGKQNEPITFVIDRPGRFVLNEDVSEHAVTAIRIEADNVVLDGGGYTLSGTFTARGFNHGVHATNANNVTVKNLNITNWNAPGILFENIDGGKLRNIIAFYNLGGQQGLDGIGKEFQPFGNIIIRDSSRIDISNINIDNHKWLAQREEAIGWPGLTLYNSNYNSLSDIILLNNGLYGLTLFKSSNNIISGMIASNTVGEEHLFLPDSTPGAGIRVVESHNNIFSDIVANNNHVGIRVTRSHNNEFSDIIVNNNRRGAFKYGVKLRGYGIRFFDSNSNELKSIDAHFNGCSGIYLTNSLDNDILNVNITNNGFHRLAGDKRFGTGIQFSASSNYNTLHNSNINNTINIGLKISESNNNNIHDNNFEGNHLGLSLIDNSRENRIHFNNFISTDDNNILYTLENRHNQFNSENEIDYDFNGIAFRSRLGNHWSNYTTPDNVINNEYEHGRLKAGSDGIVDYEHPTSLDQYSLTNRTCDYGIAPVDISIDYPTNVELDIGDTWQFNATVYPSGANQEVDWSIYPKNIGTISRYGLFTALKNGTTTVTATSQANPNLTATAKVTIRPAPEYIRIHPFIAHMYIGEIESFTATVYPDGVNQSVIWSCSGNGFISEIYGNKIEFTADSVGSATIRARSKLNSSVYETVRITIRAEEIIIEEEEDEEDDATVPCTDPGVDAPLGVAMGGAVEGGVGADAEKDGKAAEGGGTPIGVAVADAAIDGADARDVAEAADAGKTVAGRVMAVVESIIDKPYRAHKVNLSLSTIFGAMILIGFIAIGYMIISDKHKRKQW